MRHALTFTRRGMSITQSRETKRSMVFPQFHARLSHGRPAQAVPHYWWVLANGRLCRKTISLKWTEGICETLEWPALGSRLLVGTLRNAAGKRRGLPHLSREAEQAPSPVLSGRTVSGALLGQQGGQWLDVLRNLSGEIEEAKL